MNIILLTYSFVYVIWEFFYITFTIMKFGSIIAVVFLVLRLILRKWLFSKKVLRMVIIRTFADTDPVLPCDHIFHDLLIIILAPEEEGGQYCNHVCLFVCLSVNIVRKLYLRWGSVLPKHDPNLERDFKLF